MIWLSRTLLRTGLWLLTLCGLLSACVQQGVHEDGPLVLAAASMQDSLEAAADAWADQGHPRPVLSFAASSALARQIEAGAPGDLFVSADEVWMDEIESKGLLVAGTRRLLAGNRLVLIAPADSTVRISVSEGLQLKEYLGDGRLAMADPDFVPAGRYGKQALVFLGEWDEVSDRLAVGENVRVALNFVSRAEAPLGIVYATDAQADPRVRIVGTFPEESHAAIRYPIARLGSSEHVDAAAFEAFLLSGHGQTIMRNRGFGPA